MFDSILADTSVWVTHLREGENHFIELLDHGMIVCHPFIIGELACGSLKNRKEIIRLLEALPTVDVLDHLEVMVFIESRNLMGKGIGYIDAHLLGSSLISNTPLWTLDKSLKKAAKLLYIEYEVKSNR